MEENIVICEKRDSIALVYDNLKMNEVFLPNAYENTNVHQLLDYWSVSVMAFLYSPVPMERSNYPALS